MVYHYIGGVIMRKDGKLKKFFMFQMYECAAVEEFLAEMALDGWMVEKIKGSFFTFHKIEPKKLTFAVDIFDKASEFDTIPADSTMEYIEYCKEAGWEYICARGKLQVFCSETENGIPIHTDPKLKLKAINKGMFSVLFAYILNILVGILNLIMHLTLSFSDLVTDYTTMAMFILWLSLFIFFFTYVTDYYIWLIRSIRRIKNGEDIKYSSKKNRAYKHKFQLFLIVSDTIMLSLICIYFIIHDFNYYKLLFLLGLIVIILIFVLVSKIYYKNINRSRSKNIIFTIVIYITGFYLFIGLLNFSLISYFVNTDVDSETVTSDDTNAGDPTTITLHQDEVPITMKYLGIETEGYHKSSTDTRETFLAKYYDYTDEYYINAYDNDTDNYIRYSVFTSKSKWIINHYFKTKFNYPYYDISYSETDTNLWEANSVYKSAPVHGGQLILVIYDNKILQFQSNLSLTKDQIELIREKLDLFN